MDPNDPTPTMADALRSGHSIGPFELRDAVSRSAYGIVYRAWDHGLAVAVAIEEHFPMSLARRLANGDVVPASQNTAAAYDSSLQAFMGGTRALARCDHPVLVRVLHLQTGHGTAYRVMPWVDGEPLLNARHGMSRPPGEPALRALLNDLLGALESVHLTGMVHGGVRPSRILMLRGERPLLLGPCVVTTDAGGVPGPWTDLRALADVARFCISGIPPTPEGQPVEPTAKIVERLLFDDGAVRYGQEFMHLLDAAASPAVAKRPQSVAQFRERMRQAALIDAGPWAADRPLPAELRQPAGAGADTDAATERFIQRVMEAIPPRKQAGHPPPRLDPKFGPPASSAAPTPPKAASPGSTAVRSPPRHVTAPPRRRARVRARLYAIALAIVGFTAWQWLYRPALPDVGPVLSDASAPTPAAVPSDAPVVAAPQPRPALPASETAAPAVASGIARPIEATAPVERTSATDEPAAVRPTAVRSPREACGERTQFSLYLCMQQQCARTAWANHPQCVRFRATDEVE